jgi:FkbM family methyltransferase
MMNSNPVLQSTVQFWRQIVPRGWSPLLAEVARAYPPLQSYRARLSDNDRLFIDLREYMCHTYFYYGRLPHEEGTQRLLKAVLREGSTFVDVGANVGFFTRMASHLVGPAGAVMAIEPSPTALRLLRLNTRDLENVRVLAQGLGARTGVTTFYVRKRGDTSSFDHDPKAKPVSVEVSTLDAITKVCSKVDLIKIDVEGYERDVIAGGLGSIEKHRPIVYFEYLSDFATKFKFCLKDFENIFTKLDYQMKWINQSAVDPGLFSLKPSTYVAAIPCERSLS